MKMIDIPNTDGYVTGLNHLLQTTYSYTGHKFGKARNLINIQASAEIEYFGEYNIDNININYIVGDLQKYIDFSPTAKHYHPYKNTGDKEAEEKFREVGQAYDVLKDPEKKQIIEKTSRIYLQH